MEWNDMMSARSCVTYDILVGEADEGSPMVGMVVTISPSFNLYKMVVLPAASRPTIKIPA